jgi:hypothetical protein
MAGVSLVQAKEMLSNWLAADVATSKGQSYSIDGVQVTRVDARTITEKIKYYSGLVRSLERGGSRVVRVVPRDL